CLRALAAGAQSCTSNGGCGEALASVEADRKRNGESCDNTCTLLAAGLTCDASGSSGPATSTQVSQACITQDRLFCETASGICKPRSGPGTACADDHACTSDICRQGTCESVGFEGASCLVVGGGHCAQGFYCASSSSSGLCDSVSGPCHCTRRK